jgi:hypothetical protein
MEVIILLAYIALGSGIGAAVGLTLAGRERNTFERTILITTCAACFTSVLVYLFATSVWAYSAAASRIPGIAAESTSDQFYYLLWDHTVLCAIAGSTLASLAVWSILRIVRLDR